MENKAGIIVKTLIEKLRKNTHFFGEMAIVEKYGTYGSRADIAMQNGNKTEVYSIIVVKHVQC